MENNVYQAPESDLETDEMSQGRPLASRWARLGGSIIDAIIMMLILVPLQYFLGAFDDLGSDTAMVDGIGYNFIMGLLGVVVFALINGSLLISKGQTVGKKLVGTQIVDAQTQALVTKDQLIKRYGTYFGFSIIPIVGGILSFVNIIFIFSKTKQCLHDRIGETIVVEKY